MSDSSLDILARLQAASTQSEREWLVLELSLNRLSPVVQQAVWAAAIPHWFTQDFLAALLGEESWAEFETSGGWDTLISQSFVETFPNYGYNLHERAREQLLARLWQDDVARYRDLSHKAYQYCQTHHQQLDCWQGLH